MVKGDRPGDKWRGKERVEQTIGGEGRRHFPKIDLHLHVRNREKYPVYTVSVITGTTTTTTTTTLNNVTAKSCIHIAAHFIHVEDLKFV